jgi:hypothetical protein
MATPEIEVILPGGTLYGRVEEATDTDERRIVIRQILKNAGFAGFFDGYNPFLIGDEDLMQKSAALPLLRIQPLGIGNAAYDPGGWLWITGTILTIAVIVLLVILL